MTKPILLPLSNNLTKYCYVCQKRCHNLLPCKKCALNGKGHPAFVGIKEVRKTAPPLWNNLDYASAAWVNPHSDKWNTVDGKYGTLLLDFTIAAVFLAFCLYPGGYPMDWSYSKQGNIKMNISDKLPASWIGGCLLYHLQSTRINSFGFYDVARSEEAMKYEDLSSLIYPPLSLINHSCDPSALVLITSEGVAFLMSIRDLKARNEITISYQVAYEEKNTRDHKRQLKENYFFECTCEACQNNWNNENPVEKVKCPHCQFGSELIAQTARCSKCESFLPIEEAYKLISDVRELIQEIPNISWNRRQSQNLSSLLTRAHSLLSPPCRTITLLRECIFDLLKKTAQMWTCEPWLENYYKCIAAEESTTSKKERRMILN
ncbi:unnamed protein product [Hymenolepis diminuta]|uniref:SET domain-containing protein n=1 Tax=Hymenolepis diminuta TaxID=6216 RepID=A0A564Z648_HYMDI|nr:unnamed protein product [Hymenolepis diminuta]